MDAAVADEAQQVQATLAPALHQVDEQRLLEELPAHDRRVNACDLLVDDPPRADVQVADFGISHQPVRQAHALARGVDERPGILLQEPRVIRRPRQRDGVGLALRAIPPAVEDDEHYRFWCWHARSVKSQAMAEQRRFTLESTAS